MQPHRIRLRQLLAACSDGELQTVRAMLLDQADVAASNGRLVAVDDETLSGHTALQTAAENGHLDVVRLLLELDASVDAADGDGVTPLVHAAGGGHVSIVNALLYAGASVDLATDDGKTALCAAAASGHVDVVRVLLQRDASVDLATSSGETPLYTAAEHGHVDVVQELLQASASMDLATADGNTPLYVAAEQDHVAIVQMLLDAGASADLPSSDGKTLLFIAAKRGHVEVTECLLKAGASVHLRTRTGETPLYIAAQQGHVKIVQMLVEAGASANVSMSDGRTPLFIGSQQGHVKVVEALLKAGAVVNVRAHSGATPVLIAAWHNHAEAVKLLHKHGANIHVPMSDGATPLYIAASHGHLNVAELLLEFGADVDAVHNGQTPLWAAALKGDDAMVTLLLAHTANGDAADWNRSMALYFAAKSGHLSTVSLLLEHGALVDLARRYGATPLWVAALEGHLDVVKLLVEHNADLELARHSGDTPLWAAASKNRGDVVLYLLEHGANANLVTPGDGQSILHVAASKWDGRMARALLERGADVHYASTNGCTALHYAVANGPETTVRLLLERDAPVDAQDRKGLTPLHMTAAQNLTRVARVLMSAGADVNAVARDGTTPLINAAALGHETIVQALLERDATIDKAQRDGATALFVAAKHGRLHALRVLLSRRTDASINAATTDGTPPLIAAAQSGHVDVVRELLDNGASVHARTTRGVSALHSAAAEGHSGVVALLLGAGADVHAVADDGTSPLVVAARSGHTEVVMALLAYAPDANVRTESGETLLFGAAAHGCVDLVNQLILAGAAVDAPSARGDTALIAACRNGHLETARALLDAAAAVNAVNDASETPLLASASAGHFDVARMLLDAGACADVRSQAGETVLTAAGRFRDSRIVTKLLVSGAVRFAASHTEHLPAGGEAAECVLRATLRTLQERGARMREFERMWSDVIAALVRVYGHCSALPQPSAAVQSALPQFVALVVRVAALTGACAAASVFDRVVASCTVVTSVHDVWSELLLLERAVGLTGATSASGSSYDWATTGFEQMRDELAQQLSAALRDVEQLQEEHRLQDAATTDVATADALHETAVAQLQYALQTHGATCSAPIRALLQAAVDRARALSTAPVQPTPTWFIPPDALEVGDSSVVLAANASARLVSGTWRGYAVAIQQQLTRTSSTLAVDMDKWRRLRHPSVVQVFGASSVRAPSTLVLEHVVSTSLRTHYWSGDHALDWLWHAFYEAASGLAYLHAHGVVPADVRCEHIWVAADGSAKVNVFGSSGDVDTATQANGDDDASTFTDAVRWRSPERVRGGPPTIAANVFALAMCVIEALGDYHPWCETIDNNAVAFEVTMGYQPMLPSDCNDAEQALLQMMLLDKPFERPSMATVAAYFRDFALERSREQTSLGASPATNSFTLETHVFPDLAGSIQDSLAKLQRLSPVSDDASAAHVLHRLEDVYKRLLGAHKQPSDLAVRRYCDVLRDFGQWQRSRVAPAAVAAKMTELQRVMFHQEMDSVLALLARPSDDPGRERTHSEPLGEDAIAASSSNSSSSESGDAEPTLKDTEDEVADWAIPIRDLKLDLDAPVSDSSSGASCQVYAATWLSAPVAVKLVDGSDACTCKALAHEARVWSPLRHPHVTQLFGTGAAAGKRYAVLEHARNDTLTSYLARRATARDATELWRKLHEAALGLQYLHDRNVVHNDLQCANIVVSRTGAAKLATSASSFVVNSTDMPPATRQDARPWQSPEHSRGADHVTLASDVYSFGLCIIEAATGCAPWSDISGDAAERGHVARGALPPRPASLAEHHWRLVEAMCALEPRDRVTIQTVVAKLHAFAHEHDAA